MAFTTRSEYGLRAMVLLAEQFGDELLSAAEISRREEVPTKYLEQILSALKKARLVKSRAGARGGYRLARPSHEITVADVIHAVDGAPATSPCGATSGVKGFRASNRLRPLWQRLDAAMQSVLQGTTLDQLAFSPQLLGDTVAPPGSEEGDESPGMYHI